MLHDSLIPDLWQLNLLDWTFFQQDSAPRNYASNVWWLPNDVFPHMWIGISGPITWPPHSPDLTPLDYFL